MAIAILSTAGDMTPERTLTYEQKASLSVIPSSDFAGVAVFERRKTDTTLWRPIHTFDATNGGEFYVNNSGSWSYRVRLASRTAGSVQAEVA